MLAWAFFGATCAVGAEAWFKTVPTTHWLSFLNIPAYAMGLGVNLAIWHLLHNHTLLGAMVAFSFSVACLRVLVTITIGEAVSAATMIAYGLTVLAMIVKTLGTSVQGG